MARIAWSIAGERGIPQERALDMVRTVFAAVREDLETADRFVLSGVLIVDRAPPGARSPHSVRFVFHKRQKDAERIRRLRAKRGE